MTALAPTRVAIIAALVACGGGRPGPVTAPPDVPAASWATEVSPFRLPAPAAGLWVDETRALIPIRAGWIAAVDLATGAVKARRTDDVIGDPDAIARLADGRMIALVSRKVDERFMLRIYELAPDLGLTLLREDPDAGWDESTIAVAADGRVLMAGDAHTLDLYSADAARYERTLAPDLGTDTGWSSVAFTDGDRRAIARRDGALYAVDIASGTATQVAGSGTWYGASKTGARALALVDGKLVAFDLATGSSIDLSAKAPTNAALSADGRRAAEVVDDSVMVHDTTSKLVVARFALGDEIGSTYSARLAFTPSGERIVLTTGAVVRVIDLPAGTISAAGSGPYRTPPFLTVTRDHVVVGADRVRRWPAGGGAPIVIGPDEPATTDGTVSPGGELVVAARELPRPPGDTSARDTIELTVWRASPAAETGRWTRTDSIASIALDDDGELLVGAWRSRSGEVDGVSHNVIELARARGGWKRLLEVHYDSFVDAIDPVTRLAALSRHGAVRVIQLPGTAPISEATIPTCSGTGSVDLDGPGRRIATSDGTNVFVFDVGKREARRVGAAGFPVPAGRSVFVPGRPEVVIDLDDQLGIWDYAADRAVGTLVGGIVGRIGLDPTGTRAAVVLTNGRLLVFTLADLRRGAPVALTAGASESSCAEDPLAPPDRPNEDNDSDHGGIGPFGGH